MAGKWRDRGRGGRDRGRLGRRRLRLGLPDREIRLPAQYPAHVLALLLSVAGIVIFFTLSLFAHLVLRRWHESAIAPDR